MVNPKNGSSKEEWLLAHGQPISPAEVLGLNFDGDRLPVCLVDNGWMTAAGIAYERREAEAFLYPDERPREWFLVDRALLKQFDDTKNPVLDRAS